MATSIRLSDEVSQRLDWLASKTGRTKDFYLRLIIESGVSDVEDYYLSAEEQEEIRRGQETILSAPVARNELRVQD